MLALSFSHRKCERCAPISHFDVSSASPQVVYQTTEECVIALGSVVVTSINPDYLGDEQHVERASERERESVCVWRKRQNYFLFNSCIERKYFQVVFRVFHRSSLIIQPKREVTFSMFSCSQFHGMRLFSFWNDNITYTHTHPLYTNAFVIKNFVAFHKVA